MNKSLVYKISKSLHLVFMYILDSVSSLLELGLYSNHYDAEDAKICTLNHYSIRLGSHLCSNGWLVDYFNAKSCSWLPNC